MIVQEEIVFCASLFKIWTCKEAFLKANGSGLALPINMFEVSNIADPSLSITSLEEDADQGSAWHLKAFRPEDEYWIAIALKESGKILPGNIMIMESSRIKNRQVS